MYVYRQGEIREDKDDNKIVFTDLGISLTLKSSTKKLHEMLSASVRSKASVSRYVEDFQSVLSPVVEVVLFEVQNELDIVFLEIMCDVETYKKVTLIFKEFVVKRVIEESAETEDYPANLVWKMFRKLIVTHNNLLDQYRMLKGTVPRAKVCCDNKLFTLVF